MALFQDINVRLEDKQQAERATRYVRRSTWRHVKTVHITWMLSDNDSAASGDPSWFQDGLLSLGLWLKIFKQLDALSLVEIDINLQLLSEERILELLASSEWLQVEHLFQIPVISDCSMTAPVLELNIPQSALAPDSKTWRLLLRPFKVYDKIGLSMDSFYHSYRKSSDPFYLRTIFTPGQLQKISLSASSAEDLAVVHAVKHVTSLSASQLDPSDCADLRSCLMEISESLVYLSITSSYLDEDDLILKFQDPISLPVLTRLHIDSESYSLAKRLPEIFDAPPLQYIYIECDVDLLDGDDDTEYSQLTTAWHQRQVSKLESLQRMDAMLPSRCANRKYCVGLQGDMKRMQSYLSILAPLAKLGNIDIDLFCTGPRSIVGTSQDTGGPILGLRAAMAAFPPECRSAVISMEIVLEEVRVQAIPQTVGMVEFPNLKTLTIINEEPLAAWSAKAAKNIIKKLTLPRLEALELFIGRSDPAQYFSTLETCLPSWPVINEIDFRSFTQVADLVGGVEYRIFVNACKRRMIYVHFGGPR